MPTHPSEELWRLHHADKYPSGVAGVRTAIKGTAFFPGGYGLWNPSKALPLPKFPVGGVMVLGHDFHSETGYEESLRNESESESQPTWKNLLCVLREADIALEECFFTNIYMGLRKGGETTGVFPGAGDSDFCEHCRNFLAMQISTQRPSLIITLGIYVPPFLAQLSPELHEWSLKRGLKHLDKVGPVRTGVTFNGLANYTTTVVALAHPSMRGSNLRHRRYKESTGEDAEFEMLREAKSFSAAGGSS